MNQEDILRMARQAGFEVGERERGQSVFNPHTVDECCLNAELERFATIVAAAERAACADICDQHASIEGIAQRCAAEIRARSKT